jgi:hypothetical protein
MYYVVCDIDNKVIYQSDAYRACVDYLKHHYDVLNQFQFSILDTQALVHRLSK